MSLFIYVPNDSQRELMSQQLLERRWTDSGVDIPCTETLLDFIEQRFGVCLKLGVHVAALNSNGEPVPCLLLSRSSIFQTPLRLSNQIGLIDAGYRGEVMARVDCISHYMEFKIEHGRRLFQLVQHNCLPFKEIKFVNSLAELPIPPDSRGSGGFGSTGQ